MKNKILVLGATGNIGSVLIQILKNQKADFLGGVPAAELPKLEAAGADGVDMDFNNNESIRRAMKGIDTLFMLLPLHEKMIEWSYNLLNAAKESGVRFILRSSLMDARYDSPYALYKVHGQIDRMAKESGIAYAIVHPNSFMQNFIVYQGDTILNDGIIYSAHGSARISHTDARDIALLDATILLNPSIHTGNEYDATGPEALSDEEVAHAISRAAGRNIRAVNITLQQYEEIMRLAGMTLWEIAVSLSLEKHMIDGKSALVSEDIKKVAGKEPNTFERFARDFAGSWKKEAALV